ITLGGERIAVLDESPAEAKAMAVDALLAIPGLEHGAVDYIINTDKEAAHQAAVLDNNPTSQPGGILSQLKEKSRDIPAAIIDHYFPETYEKQFTKSNTYFDLHDVLEPLRFRDAETTTVTPSPEGKIYAKKYTVIGDVQNIGYHRGLRKQA